MSRPNDKEIQRAHDILGTVIYMVEEGSAKMPDENSIHYIMQCKKTLCWILGHSDYFLENLIALEADLAGQGITFEADGNWEDFKKEHLE